MSLTVIGIDNGIHGGIAAVDESGIGRVWKMPLEPCGKRVDMWILKHIFNMHPLNTIIAIELLPDHMDSAATMRSFALNYGIIYAAAKLSGLRVVEVPCGNRLDGWQRRLMGRQTKGGNKTAAEKLARKLWPDYKFPTLRPKGKALHDGVLDACLIAYDTLQTELTK